MRCSFDNKDFCGLYIWGNGKLLRRYFNYIKDLNIVSIVDSDPNRQGYDDVTKLICVSPEHIRNDYFVILAIEDGSSIEKVGSYLDDKKIKWCHIIEVVDDLFKKRQDINIKNSIADKKIAKFIDVMIPVPFCNFQCRYCYLQQLETDYRHLPNTYHDVDFIRHALRKPANKKSRGN